MDVFDGYELIFNKKESVCVIIMASNHYLFLEVMLSFVCSKCLILKITFPCKKVSVVLVYL